MFESNYGETIRKGDWVVWCRCKGSLFYGQVLSTTECTLKVAEYSIRWQILLKDIPGSTIQPITVRTKAVLRAIPMSLNEK